MKFYLFLIIATISVFKSFGQTDTMYISVDGVKLHAVLSKPEKNPKDFIVIMIAGSGPTDLNGNNPMMQNNSLLYLSEALNGEGIATLRFDKRGVANSAYIGFSEFDLTIDVYAKDVKSIIQEVKKFGFKKIYVLGHSEGSLIGLMALQSEKVDGFISLCGVGRTADEILRTQLKGKIAQVQYEKADSIMVQLKAGEKVKDVPFNLFQLFRPSVQPYLISWFTQNPVSLIKELNMPVMIVQGDKDLQVDIMEAELLHKAKPKAEYYIISGMNHVLKKIDGGQMANRASYNNALLPVHNQLPEIISSFILTKK